MKTGIQSTVYFNRFGVEFGSQLAHLHGYDCVDYSNFINTETDFFCLGENAFEKQLKFERTAMEKNEIKVSQVHAPWRYPPRDLTKEDRSERFESMSKAIRGCAYLNSPFFVVHALMPYGPDTDENASEMLDINFDFMNRLCDAAGEYGVTVCLENLPFRNLPLNTCEQVLDFVKRVDRDNFKICLDTGHAIIKGISPADAARLFGKEYLRTMHVHDNDGHGDSHKNPGMGIIDWNDFSHALGEIGFGGVVSLETGVFSDGENWDAEAKRLADIAGTIAGKTNKFFSDVPQSY